MEFLSELWLPILLSAVGVFIVSSLVHMVLQIHKGDYAKLANEETILANLRTHKIPPGQYMFPCAGSMKEMGTPEFTAKCNLGPVGTLIVRPNGNCGMNKALGQWFIFSLVISIFAAYLSRFALPNGASFGSVLRIAGTVATLGYGVSSIPDSIWKGLGWKVTWKFVFDGLLYGLTTGVVFALMWPKLGG